YTYYAGAIRIAEPAAPPVKNHSWTLTADITANGEKTEGVIMAFGGVAAGIVLYVDKGVPNFTYNYFEHNAVAKRNAPLRNDKAKVEVDFDYLGGNKPGGPANIPLKVDGQNVAAAKMDATVPGRFGIDTFGIGEDTGQPVIPSYKPPFKFN